MGDGYHNLVGVFAASYESSIAFTQSHLCLSADVMDRFAWCFESQLQVSTDVWLDIDKPRRLQPEIDEHACDRLWCLHSAGVARHGKIRMVCMFWLTPVALSENHGYAPRELNRIRALILENLTRILEA
jgi:hypothetical protein